MSEFFIGEVVCNYAAGDGAATRRLWYLLNPSTSRKNVFILGWDLSLTCPQSDLNNGVGVSLYRLSGQAAASAGTVTTPKGARSSMTSIVDARHSVDATGVTVSGSVAEGGAGIVYNVAMNNDAATGSNATIQSKVALRDYFGPQIPGLCLAPGESFGIKQHNSFGVGGGLLLQGAVYWEERDV